jgi:proteasome alpha subunit
VAIGSGRDDIQEFLEAEWAEELTLDDGVELAVRALLQTDDELDAASMSVATITADGYRAVPDDDLEPLIEEHAPADDDAEDADDGE